jgi:hypothetical protein
MVVLNRDLLVRVTNPSLALPSEQHVAVSEVGPA